MRQEIYPLESKDSMMTFEFISEGPKGSIKKRVLYEKMKDKDTFNLAFGDVNEETDDFDDTTISANDDIKKVLATVAETVRIFLNENPDARIYAKGSNFTRTRLYRIGISNNLDEINKHFIVFGLLEDRKWHFYEINKNYLAFLIIKK